METLKFRHVFTHENPGNIDDFYDIEKKALGEGSYGIVSKATSKSTKAIRAIKSVDKRKGNTLSAQRLEEEIAIQQQLDHPHIVKLYEVFSDAKRIYLVMELCTGGELFDRIIQEAERNADGIAFDEGGAATYMVQILGAMCYLHKCGYAHRDIKPENFLLQSPDRDAPIKIIDFGLAKAFTADSPPMTTKAGTPYYVAPEVLAGAYNEKCDIWSCGVICYILLCGYPPFFGDSDREILRSVKKGAFDFPSPEWDKISDEAKDLIKQMLTFDAVKRPTASQLLDHGWLKKEAKRPAATIVVGSLTSKLKAWRSASKLKKVALTVIAKQLCDADIEELKKTFEGMDENRDGTLTIQELKEGMLSHKVEIPDDLQEIMRDLDTDGSGSIDYTEFIAATIEHRQYYTDEVLWAAFRTFDRDGDGQITREELRQVLGDNQEELIQSMIESDDVDGDGNISFDEFSQLMRR